jgi:hypothetical protein
LLLAPMLPSQIVIVHRLPIAQMTVTVKAVNGQPQAVFGTMNRNRFDSLFHHSLMLRPSTDRKYIRISVLCQSGRRPIVGTKTNRDGKIPSENANLRAGALKRSEQQESNHMNFLPCWDIAGRCPMLVRVSALISKWL